MAEYDQNRAPRPPREKHYLDDFKLRLTADPVQGSNRKPTLHATVVGNNPRIDVYTNKLNDKDNGAIHGKLDSISFYTLLVAFEDIIKKNQPNSQYSMTCNRPGQNRGEFVKESTVVVGIDDKGLAYITVVSADPDRPKIKFVFGNTSFHALAAGNGRKLSDAEVSILFAEGWIKTIYQTAGNILTDKYVHREPEKKPGGYQKKPWQGGGGGNSNWKDRQNNQQRQPQPETEGGSDGGFDDDLPF